MIVKFANKTRRSSSFVYISATSCKESPFITVETVHCPRSGKQTGGSVRVVEDQRVDSPSCPEFYLAGGLAKVSAIF